MAQVKKTCIGTARAIGWGMLQMPRLLTLFDATGLNEPAVIIGVKGLLRLVNSLVGQQH
jgi:hypothetical protein